jgi:hypothetical protein
MKDRFKDLAKQAGIWFEDSKEIRTHSVSTTTLEKFAESVVQECLLIAQAGNAVAVSDVIKETFGVDNE